MLANKSVLKRYLKQKSRGTEGFGFIEIKNGKVSAGKRAEDENDILKALEKSDADEILFHHRFPTSTPNIVEATHPIVVKNKKLKYDYYVVHNGVIFNDVFLKGQHNNEGYKYTTVIETKTITNKNTYSTECFNDSESLAIDFVKSIETGSKMESEGSIAVIALQVDKKTKNAVALYYGRNKNNPLCVEIQKDFFAISSETGKEIPTDTLFRYDYVTNEITEEKRTIGAFRTIYPNMYGDDLMPDYGHYDENTGKWLESTKPNYCSLLNDDYDDENFNYEWDENIENIKEEIRKARKLENWDAVAALYEELETMKTYYEELEREEKRKKNNKDAKRKLGFKT